MSTDTTQFPAHSWVRARPVRKPRRVRKRPGVYRSRGPRPSTGTLVWEVVKEVVAATVFSLAMFAFIAVTYLGAAVMFLQ